MKRRLFTILSALSLLLFVAVVVLWVRSYWVADIVAREFDGWAVGMSTGSGELALGQLVSNTGGTLGVAGGYHSEPPADVQDYTAPKWSMMGLRYYYQSDPSTTYYQLRIPLWWIAVAAVLLAVSTAVATGRKRRPGLCPSCGYDLRATPGRCPECGLVPAAPPTPPTSRGNAQ